MMVALVVLISSWLLRYNVLNVVDMHVNNAILIFLKVFKRKPPLSTILLQQLLMVNIFSALMIEMYIVIV